MSDKNRKEKNNEQNQKPVGQVRDVTTTIKGIFESKKKSKS